MGILALYLIPFLLCCSVLAGIFDYPATSAQSDPLQRTDPPRWIFGEGLRPGDLFEYKICDFALRIPESPGHCYLATLHFLHVLPSTDGKIWIVSASINHGIRTVETVLHVSAESFSIKTDGTSIQYASSLERTLGWMQNYAQKHRPQALLVGKSWGTVAADTSPSAELLVNRADSLMMGNKTVQTYNIGYLLVNESFFQIQDGFPFPIQALAYKPVSSHQNVPLSFTLDLISHSNSGLRCESPSKSESVPSYFAAKSSLTRDELETVLSDTDDVIKTVPRRVPHYEAPDDHYMMMDQNHTVESHMTSPSGLNDTGSKLDGVHATHIRDDLFDMLIKTFKILNHTKSGWNHTDDK